MHVFIDTNILLSFFHFSKDDLDALDTVFSPHGSAVVYLTDQVHDELRRNRESKIKDALQRFENAKFKAQIPHFMKKYPEYEDIIALSGQLEEKRKSIMKNVNSDIQGETLPADRLIAGIFGIFQRHPVKQTTDEIFTEAWRRVASGNPPGKDRSMGDAINWVTLLHSVPDKNTLHVVSEDGDYYSVLDKKSAHPFLRDEWKRKKHSELYVYRTLTDFTRAHFDGIVFAFDSEKEQLIDNLEASGSFAMTHKVVRNLERYEHFSLTEVNRILQAACDNDQVGAIVTDLDVSDFLNRVAVPRMGDVSKEEHKRVLRTVIDQVGSR